MIYFVLSKMQRAIKIGYTENDIQSRFSQLQTGNPEKLILLGWCDGDEEDEKRIHGLFRNYRLYGEWFQEKPKLLKYISKVSKEFYGDEENESFKTEYMVGYSGFNLNEVLKKIEKQFIEQALELSKGNKTRAAKILNISRVGLHYKLERLK